MFARRGESLKCYAASSAGSVLSRMTANALIIIQKTYNKFEGEKE